MILFKFQITSKIQDKVKIIKLLAEEGQSLGMRKFTDLVENKLGLIVSRATITSICTFFRLKFLKFSTL